VVASERVSELHLDTARIALGGLSAGGGLAAITGLKIAESNSSDVSLTNPIIQLLVCPVIDNTVSIDTDPSERAGWQAVQHSPWLTPTRMQWYRDQYFGGAPSTATAEWTASPCYAPQKLLAASPPTFLGIAGCDLLAPEAKAYGAQLATAGVAIDVQTYAGGTHSVLVLAG
jgi:acetyl esterase/lipase